MPPANNDAVYVIIKDIQVEGNEKTIDNVILAESKLNVGDSISLTELAKELKNSQQNILNTRLFNQVDLLISDWQDDEIELQITVDERWYIYPIPVFELTGITFGEWVNNFDADLDRVTYGLEVKHFNARKRAERLELVAKTGFQQQYAASYFFPGLDKARNLGLGFGVSHLENKGATTSINNHEITAPLFDTDVLQRTQANVIVTYRKEITRRHSLSIGVRTTEIADTILDLSSNFFAGNSLKQSFFDAQYTINMEHRNLLEYPTEGYYLFGFARYEGIGTSGLDLFSSGFIANKYSKVGKKTFLSGSLQSLYIGGETIPFNNLISKRLDDDVFRGYEDYVLVPKSYFLMKSELRYALVDKQFQKVPVLPKQFEPVPFKIYPKLFVDFGRTFSDQLETTNPLNDDLLYSFGAGVDLVTLYNLPIRFEFSQNHLKENNLSFSIGKSF